MCHYVYENVFLLRERRVKTFFLIKHSLRKNIHQEAIFGCIPVIKYENTSLLRKKKCKTYMLSNIV